jgi:antitoxin (DNA-binding transcriptional repressor) of toxin-antitoxin stability system
MKRATLEKVQARLGDFVTSSAKQPVVILRDGEPVALLIGLARKENKSPIKLRTVLQRAWKDFQENGGISHAEFWDDLATEVAKS